MKRNLGTENTKLMMVDSMNKYLEEKKKSLSSCYYYWNLNISGQNCCCWSMDDFFFLLGRMDYDNIRKRGGRALLALRIPIKHDLNFDTKNSLTQKEITSTQQSIYYVSTCFYDLSKANLSEKNVSNS